MKKYITLATVLGIGFFNMINAQNAFNKKTADEGSIKVIFDFPGEGRNSKNGSGYSANVELIDPKPKKIALISFYLYDPAKGKAEGGKYVGAATAKIWRTSNEVGQAHVDAFYNQGIEAMKTAFKGYGMDLLTPEEFLDTDEKADYYYHFSQESAKKEKTSATITKQAGTGLSTVATANVSTLKVTPSKKGYRAFFVENEAADESEPFIFKSKGIFGADRKMTSSLGYELCKELGVDAVVVCYVVTRKLKMNKNDHGVNAVNLLMFGPNPMSNGPEDKNRGQFYCGTRVYFKGASAVFHDDKTNTLKVDGFENVVSAMSKKLANWVINKEKK
jgi:hypothetical protein